MPDCLNDFRKKKDYLICIDSDGCAMDTMDLKHIDCFGPCLIPVWGLQPWQDQILKRWNDINLYTMTRGINRFKGLAQILSEIHGSLKPIDGIEAFSDWTKDANELSNSAVKRKWEESGLIIFKQALEWSEEVNRRIKGLPVEQKKAFSGVKDGLLAARAWADLVIVSSANSQAVMEEWREQGLLELVDLVLSQDAGTKADCITALVKTGYMPEHVLMVGDAPGDCQAAEDNGVNFYPILVGKENESWKQFREKALEHLKNGTYRGAWQEYLKKEFEDNLNK